MSRLFFKIFGWFWLVQVFIGLVMYQLAVYLPPAPNMDRWRPITSAALRLQARTALAVYRNEGRAGLAQALQDLRGRGQSAVFAFDDKGVKIAGPPAPESASTLARQAAASGNAEFAEIEGGWLGAQAIAPDVGHKLVFVARVQREARPRRSGGRPPSNNFIIRDLNDPSRMGLVRLLALLVTSGIVCYGLALYLASPAVKLRRATRQLASGDLSARVAGEMGRRRDELADLGQDFDRMAERIEGLMQAERRLLADISHELRSPLARLNVALDLAEGGADTKTQEYLDRIRRESERLNILIGQLLSLSRLESGSSRIDTTPIDLRQLLREVVQDADFEAQGRGRRVEMGAGPECWTRGDAQLLRSALENVVRNGVHYTADGTSVEVTLQCPAPDSEKAPDPVQRAVITVHDHGPGVPEASLENLFRPFYRVADARDRQSGGTGLGLAITERAVRVHGGTVVAANTSTGLKITLTLPIQSTTDKPADSSTQPTDQA